MEWLSVDMQLEKFDVVPCCQIKAQTGAPYPSEWVKQNNTDSFLKKKKTNLFGIKHDLMNHLCYYLHHYKQFHNICSSVNIFT